MAGVFDLRFPTFNSQLDEEGNMEDNPFTPRPVPTVPVPLPRPPMALQPTTLPGGGPNVTIPVTPNVVRPASLTSDDESPPRPPGDITQPAPTGTGSPVIGDTSGQGQGQGKGGFNSDKFIAALRGLSAPPRPDVVKPSTPAAPRVLPIKGGNLLDFLQQVGNPRAAAPRITTLGQALGTGRY